MVKNKIYLTKGFQCLSGVDNVINYSRTYWISTATSHNRSIAET